VAPQPRSIALELAIVIAAGAGPMIAAGALLFAPAAEEPPSPFQYVSLSDPTHTIVVLATYALFVLAPAIAIARSGRLLDHFGIVWRGRGDVTGGVAVCLANYAIGWLVWLAYRATGFPLGPEDIAAFHYVHAASVSDLVGTWPWYVLVVLAEELMARCYLITRIRDLTGSPVAAVALSSAAYALWHLFWGWAGALHVFMAGLIFGASFVARSGVGAAAVGHFVFDALTLLPR
jgi:membrane protease YdiL (CAAX protease family)